MRYPSLILTKDPAMKGSHLSTVITFSWYLASSSEHRYHPVNIFSWSADWVLIPHSVMGSRFGALPCGILCLVLGGYRYQAQHQQKDSCLMKLLRFGREWCCSLHTKVSPPPPPKGTTRKVGLRTPFSLLTSGGKLRGLLVLTRKWPWWPGSEQQNVAFCLRTLA